MKRWIHAKRSVKSAEIVDLNPAYRTVNYAVTHGLSDRYNVKGKVDDDSKIPIWIWISKDVPFNQSSYYWAKMDSDGKVLFMLDGVEEDDMYMYSYEDTYFEKFQDYIDEVVDVIVDELILLNKHAGPQRSAS